MGEIIGAVILFIISAFAFFMSIRSFMEKGFLFNNAYIYASQKEREAMNKTPHYRQSAIVFIFIGLVFLLNGLELLLKTDWIFFIVIAVVVIAIIYAIVSSIIIEKTKKH